MILRGLLFLAFVVVAASRPVLAQESPALPPDRPVAGLSQAEWSRVWWQWAASFERSESPVADTSGALCDRGQRGPVWFLAGTYETVRTTRSCHVPHEKFVFFPLINYVVTPRGNRHPTCADVSGLAAATTDGVSNLIVELDGVRIQGLAGYRQVTRQCFDLAAGARPAAPIFPSAANGYYVMLKPLAPGRHVLHFGGILPGIAQALTYTLDVE